jgi:RHH-type proline utilization regulon transcriptional repressor/proline dehydrogenase/delta 1-pyrroline-5-carboxylate dehydrogenase
MLSGMAEPVKVALAGMGYRVRDYCPVGDVLPGMSYLVRRLLENTSNEGFLRATFNAHVRPESLLRDQAQSSLTTGKTAGLPIKAKENGGIMHHFTNEPLTDFTIADNRRRMKDALQATRKQFDRFYPLVIGGREVRTEREIASINPARPSEIIGRVAKGNPDHRG